VYVKEAHPEDEWQMDSNEEQGICYAQPTTLAERLAIAGDFVKHSKYEIPLFVDNLENRADDLYAAWPERLYVIDESGLIAYKGGMGPFGYEPDEVEAWLAARFAASDSAAEASAPLNPSHSARRPR
jgi:type I thyroxine 5'-deiodinase